MREILFCGKRVDNGEWIYGYYIKATHHWHNHGIHEDWIATDTIQNGGWCNVRGKYAVIPETVGQYTGLTDKNGNKIFEGDIVSAPIYSDIGCYPHTESKIIFVKIPEIYKMAFDGNFEIIGNIHENPELLKGGEADA